MIRSYNLKSNVNSITVFDLFNYFLMILIGLICLYPLYNVLIVSFNDPVDAYKGGLFFFIRKFSLVNYKYFLLDDELTRGSIVTVTRTLLGTPASVFFNAMFAYGMSKSYLLGRKYIIKLMIIPMYLSGGLIPYYLLIRGLGLMNNFLVFIIPLMFNAYFAILFITYFRTTIPKDLEDSARIDGSNDLYIFFMIIVPLSTPILATVAVFSAVGQWTSWFDAVLFGGKKYQTLQSILVRIIMTAQVLTEESGNAAKEMAKLNSISNINTQSLMMTAMIVTTIPVVVVYPLMQRYFVKGIMIGSLKG